MSDAMKGVARPLAASESRRLRPTAEEAPTPIAWLDWSIAESLRSQPRDLTRARVVVGTAITMSITAVFTTALVPVFGISGLSAVVFGACALLYASAAVAIRRFAALRLATLLVAGTLGGVLVLMAAQRDGAHFVVSPWNAAIPLFVTYVAGPRLGLAVASILGVLYFGVWDLHTHRLALDLFEVPPLALPAVWVHLAGLPLVSGFGWLYRATRDHTEARLEASVSALRAEENKLASVIESTDDAVASIDADHRLVCFNEAARSLLIGDGRREPMPGDEFLRFVRPPQRATWRAWFATAARKGGIRVENTVERATGTTHWELAITPIRGEDRAGFTLYARDITTKKRAEDELAALNQEMVRLSRRAGMADVATSVLHNIGNALTSTITSSGCLSTKLEGRERGDLTRLLALLPADPDDMRRFMAEDPRAKAVRPYLEKVDQLVRSETDAMREEVRLLRDSLTHIRQVIGAQQDLARSGKFVEPCDPREVVGCAVRLTASQHQPFSLVTEFADDLPTFESDRHRVLQILANLLLNARDAVMADPRDGRAVHVVARQGPDTVIFDVRDTGIGIDRENLDAIFRHGFTTKPTGHGFGLHSAANDARAMGGRLSVRSDGPGTGATFSLELPLRASERAPAAA